MVYEISVISLKVLLAPRSSVKGGCPAWGEGISRWRHQQLSLSGATPSPSWVNQTQCYALRTKHYMSGARVGSPADDIVQTLVGRWQQLKHP